MASPSGQVNSYITGVKWVEPVWHPRRGVGERTNPELLPFIRASYGLAGIVYEVTFRIKPLEIVRFDYHLHDVDAVDRGHDLAGHRVERQHGVLDDRSEGGHPDATTAPPNCSHEFLADARRFGWRFLGGVQRPLPRQRSRRR